MVNHQYISVYSAKVYNDSDQPTKWIAKINITTPIVYKWYHATEFIDDNDHPDTNGLQQRIELRFFFFFFLPSLSKNRHPFNLISIHCVNQARKTRQWSQPSTRYQAICVSVVTSFCLGEFVCGFRNSILQFVPFGNLTAGRTQHFVPVMQSCARRFALTQFQTTDDLFHNKK